MESRTPKEWFDYYATLRMDELDVMVRTRNVDLSACPSHHLRDPFYGKEHLVTKLSQSHGYTPTQKELEEMLRKSFSWRERDERARASCERRWLQAAEEAKAAGAWVQDAPPSATPELFDGAWVTAGPTKRKQGRQVRDLDRTRERELLFVDALAQELNASRVDDDDEASLALARRLQSTRDQERREREADVLAREERAPPILIERHARAIWRIVVDDEASLALARRLMAEESSRAATVPRRDHPATESASARSVAAQRRGRDRADRDLAATGLWPAATEPPPRVPGPAWGPPPAPAVAPPPAPPPAPAATQAARPGPRTRSFVRLVWT